MTPSLGWSSSLGGHLARCRVYVSLDTQAINAQTLVGTDGDVISGYPHILHVTDKATPASSAAADKAHAAICFYNF